MAAAIQLRYQSVEMGRVGMSAMTILVTTDHHAYKTISDEL
jgi:hypothetical protein